MRSLPSKTNMAGVLCKRAEVWETQIESVLSGTWGMRLSEAFPKPQSESLMSLGQLSYLQ